MPVSVESRITSNRARSQVSAAGACLSGLANRPEPDWQGWTPPIRHQGAEWRRIGRARVSTTKSEIGDGR
jgi:hypothetical protein